MAPKQGGRSGQYPQIELEHGKLCCSTQLSDNHALPGTVTAVIDIQSNNRVTPHNNYYTCQPTQEIPRNFQSGPGELHGHMHRK